jgi:hypothetical protein
VDQPADSSSSGAGSRPRVAVTRTIMPPCRHHYGSTKGSTSIRRDFNFSAFHPPGTGDEKPGG